MRTPTASPPTQFSTSLLFDACVCSCGSSRPSSFRYKNRDDYAVTVCAQDTEFVLLHKLDEEDLSRCRAATVRRRSDACPGGPCVCRNLGRKSKVARKVVRTFSDAEILQQRLGGGTTAKADST